MMISPIKAYAEAPYKTYTLGPKGKLVETQTAYEPGEILNLDLNSPEDMYYKEDGSMYIADTGNSRIIKIGKDKKNQYIGADILKAPTGVFVDDNNDIYVADRDNKRVYIFNSKGEFKKEIDKPKEPLYGKSADFVPEKISVDKRGNIYVITGGGANGVAQLNNKGQFLGYFASNLTETSLKMVLQRTFFTENQMKQLFKNTPSTPTNLTIDEKGLVYTVTKGLQSESIKKFNIAGENILTSDLKESDSFIDIAVDVDGNMFSIDEYGRIYEYDSFGNFIFGFGGKDIENGRVGLTKNPTALSVTESKEILILDKERGVVQTYKQTNFASEVHKGILLYKDGLYTESKETWNKVLNMNNSFILSYEALAKAALKNGENKEALNYFELAEYTKGYSDAFWEIRNEWLQNNLVYIILAIIVLAILNKLLKKRLNRTKLVKSLKNNINNIKNKKLISELIFIKKFIKKPLDSYYELKRKNRVSILSSTILYILLFVLQITNVYLKSFTFGGGQEVGKSLTGILITVYGPLVLWIISNYLVSTINDGEGRLKDIYNGTIYAMAPYILGALPLQLLTKVLTLNEKFIYDFSMNIIIAWSTILMFVMIKEIHNYSFKETIKNILLTIFGMVLMTLVIALLYMLITQEVDFVKSIIQEVRVRV